MKKVLFFAVVILLFLACKEEGKTILTTGSQVPVDSLFVDFYSFKKSINPIESTKAGYRAYNDTIANYISDDYQLHLKERYAYFLDALSQYDSISVGADNWMSLKVMEWDCSIKLEGLMNPLTTMASPIYDLPSFELMPLFQIQSLHLYVAQLGGGSSVQPFITEEDYRNWLERLADYLVFIDTCIVKMEEGIQQGIVLPKTLTLKMLSQIQSFINVPLEKNLFYKPILNFSETVPQEKQEKLKKAYTAFISDKLVPKYELLNNFLVEIYLPACRTTDGIGDLPNGVATYNYLIRLHTTTNLSADEIHNLGLSEVARIRGEMEKVKSEIGFTIEYTKLSPSGSVALKSIHFNVLTQKYPSVGYLTNSGEEFPPNNAGSGKSRYKPKFPPPILSVAFLAEIDTSTRYPLGLFGSGFEVVIKAE